eukprot:TRINITY_DN22990_c0_g1_i1.p1 TRINITY_DN22990_c0_g1~~TRINITY_DN22990_c0_g1_i1.p1  ORF type:complete len:269 (-),score=58.24 TRINITY_DN22990_c0_g1_i1:333-1139(-)
MKLAVRALTAQVCLWSSSAFVSRSTARSAASLATNLNMSAAVKGDAESAQYTLYASAQCPYAQRSVITANELGVPFKLHPIELGRDNKQDWYQKINPVGKVPAVQAGDDIVVESLVINEYLVEKFGADATSTLMPVDALGRALVRIAVQRCSQLVDAYMGYLRTGDADKEEAFVKELNNLEQILTKSTSGWLVGQHMTLADVAYFPFFERAIPCLAAFRGFDWDAAGVPHVMSWFERCKSRPAVAETLRKDPHEWVDIYSKYLGVPTK